MGNAYSVLNGISNAALFRQGTQETLQTLFYSNYFQNGQDQPDPFLTPNHISITNQEAIATILVLIAVTPNEGDGSYPPLEP